MKTHGDARVRRALGVLAVLLGLATAAGAQQLLTPRQVAAPPEDIVSGLLRLPDPASVGEASRTAWLRVPFVEQAGGGWIARLAVPVGRAQGRATAVPEGAGRLALLPMGVGAERWELRLQAPGDLPYPLEQELAAGRARQLRGTVDQLAPGFQAVGTEVPATPGVWTVTLRAPPGPRQPVGYLVATASGAGLLESYLGTHALLAGDPIGVRARLGEVAQVTSMSLHARTSDGELLLPMADDGLHDDGLAGDGLYGAILPPTAAGRVFAQVVARGVDGHGLPLLRTTQHAFTLIERAAVLTGEVDSVVLDDTRLGLRLGAWAFGEPRPLQVSTEVWGTDATGALVPVAWLSTMLPAVGGMNADPTSGETVLPLALDVRWLNRVGATAPLELRRLRIQDPDTATLVDTLDRVRMESVAQPLLFGAPPGPVLVDMTMGPSPLDAGARVGGASTTAGGASSPLSRGLVLSHGYCSSGGIWPLQQFTGNALQFVDPDQNRSHDTFAQLIGAFGAQLDSFGLLAHSQGGAAGLHLYTYYRSGLDQAKGGRLIQAVATPWQGSPLASSLAGLGGIFGVGCGANDDLSSAGAAAWLAGIPSWARAQVFYWTTQNSGSACNSLTNLFLSSPNDGVVEKSKGQLPGATDMGHIVGWCHTTGMSNPANYLDAALNMQRDAAAAR